MALIYDCLHCTTLISITNGFSYAKDKVIIRKMVSTKATLLNCFSLWTHEYTGEFLMVHRDCIQNKSNEEIEMKTIEKIDIHPNIHVMIVIFRHHFKVKRKKGFSKARSI
ncbi:unnamed protein product [Orchesella dallaii]|uniref:Uncharacterized protein n=1 Tax=Orchesella dallaii TaxID=48710 RepID=A0ABP1R1R0_9HEXA